MLQPAQNLLFGCKRALTGQPTLLITSLPHSFKAKRCVGHRAQLGYKAIGREV